MLIRKYLKIFIISMAVSSSVIASPNLATLYKLPNTLEIQTLSYNGLLSNNHLNSYTVVYEQAHLENNIDSQIIDSDPIREEIINKTFLQASKTFYWSEIL